MFFMMTLLLSLAVRVFMHEFLETFVTQECTAQHQQRNDGPRSKCADCKGRRHQYRLVHHRAFGYGPHHRQFPLGFHAGHLLRIERKVIA